MSVLNFNAKGVKPHDGFADDISEQARDTARVWSTYQQRIFEFGEHGKGNAIVEAVAGSGKSTTIVETLKRVQGSSLFLAFNKPIAEELKSRGVNARTFHSLCYSAVVRSKGVNSVDQNKLRRLCDANLKGEESFMYGLFISRLVSIAKGSGVGCLIKDTPQAWVDIIEHHDLELENDNANETRAIELASDLLRWSNASDMVDFDDLLYLAVRDGIALPKFDFVFVDEAQDTNAIQRAVLRKVLKPTSRMIAVGDPSQAIYGFRGADSDSMDLIASEFDCVRLPLTVSYRCPEAVVKYAREWVSHIEVGPNAQKGNVTSLGEDWTLNEFQNNDLVVCRFTKPIIQLAYKLLKARIPVRIMGKEIGKGLQMLIGKMHASSIDMLQDRLIDYCAREVEKATAKMLDGKAASIQDKVDCILCLIEALNEDNRTVPALIGTISELFNEKQDCVVLSTIHRAKGLEADRVFWLDRSKCPSKWARPGWQQQQERNLCYVATTRAKSTLILIETKR